MKKRIPHRPRWEMAGTNGTRIPMVRGNGVDIPSTAFLTEATATAMRGLDPSNICPMHYRIAGSLCRDAIGWPSGADPEADRQIDEHVRQGAEEGRNGLAEIGTSQVSVADPNYGLVWLVEWGPQNGQRDLLNVEAPRRINPRGRSLRDWVSGFFVERWPTLVDTHTRYDGFDLDVFGKRYAVAVERGVNAQLYVFGSMKYDGAYLDGWCTARDFNGDGSIDATRRLSQLFFVLNCTARHIEPKEFKRWHPKKR